MTTFWLVCAVIFIIDAVFSYLTPKKYKDSHWGTIWLPGGGVVGYFKSKRG